MINDLEYNILKAIRTHKQVTEVYLGFLEFSWEFSLAEYSATCIEAIDLSLLDKAICGLLQVEDSLSLEKIGNILGFNVEDKPNEKKYKDLAEYELLREGIQHLCDFEMIECNDIHFSECRITQTGREYAGKKKKFRTIEEKVFSLFFDVEGGIHKNAKKLFGNKLGSSVEVPLSDSIDYEDEAFVKSFATHQIPGIYDLEKMNSFKDLELKKVNSYQTELIATFLYSIENKQIRLVVYNPSTQEVDKGFTNLFTESPELKKELISDFWRNSSKLNTLSRYKETPKMWRDNILSINKKLNLLVEKKNIKGAKKALNQFRLSENFSQYKLFCFWLPKVIELAKGEVYLSLKSYDRKAILLVKEVIQKISDKDKFLFIDLEVDKDNPYLIEEVLDLKETANSTNNSYVLFADEVECFQLICDVGGKRRVYSEENYRIELMVESKKNYFDLLFVLKTETSIDDLTDEINEIKNDFAEESVSNIISDIQEYMDDYSPSEENDLKDYKLLESCTNKTIPFAKLDNYTKLIEEVEVRKASLLEDVKTIRREILKQKIKDFQSFSASSYRDCQNFRNQIETFKLDCLDSELSLFEELDNLITKQEFSFKLIEHKNTIIICYDIFLNDAQILQKVYAKDKVVLSSNIFKRLESWSELPEYKTIVPRALSEIQNFQKKKRITLNQGKKEVLENKFKTSPFSEILSMGRVYSDRSENPIILTNHPKLIEEARLLGLNTISEKAFNDIISLKNKLGKSKSRNKFKKNKN
ncbi:hypothetical protein [Aureispira anguillae]|uniref:Uncharacterized protein n=1 Tax=Aureispira anguillae TaxID=2864201 RepID=A0A915VK86_9BACT|nr:hypothetical protein [Aureispira anguillae]BDS09577.1 hypothetical protein AsAng_0002810 [Aureispira anguillae]